MTCERIVYDKETGEQSTEVTVGADEGVRAWTPRAQTRTDERHDHRGQASQLSDGASAQVMEAVIFEKLGESPRSIPRIASRL